MRLFNFVSVKLTLGLIVGIVIGFYTDIPPQLPLLGLLALLPVLYKTYTKPPYEGFPYFALSVCFATVLLGLFAVRMASATGLPHHYAHRDLTVDHVWQLKINEVLKPNAYTQRYVAQVLSVDQQESTGKIIVSLPLNPTELLFNVDDELVVFSTAKEIAPPLHPHQFNYKAYLKKQGIYHQIRTHFQALHHVEHPSRTLKGLAATYREHLITQLEQEAFGKDERAVIQALLLGKRDDIAIHTYNAYKDAGALHILAVSGLHVGILLLLLQWILSPLERLPRGKALKLMVIVGLL